MAGWAGGGGCGGPSPPLHQLPQVRAYLPASLPLDITECRAWLKLGVCLSVADDGDARVKFLATFLSRVNQHEAAVLANKFPNLHLYGCWWYCNNPSIIREVCTPPMPACLIPCLSARSAPPLSAYLDQRGNSLSVVAPVCVVVRSRRCGWRSWARASRRSTATPACWTSSSTSGRTPERCGGRRQPASRRTDRQERRQAYKIPTKEPPDLTGHDDEETGGELRHGLTFFVRLYSFMSCVCCGVQVIGEVLTGEYLKVAESGWAVSRKEIRRDIRRLLGGAYEEFMCKRL